MPNHGSQIAYCVRCGTGLEHPPGAHPRCPACGRIAYEDPKLAAAAIIPLDGGIVLVRRGIEPATGKWSFPSGYVNRGEKVELAVEREVREECGLDVSASWLVGLYSDPGSPVVLGVYHADVVSGTLSASDEETLETGVFSPDALPQLAFEHDDRILADWHQELSRRGMTPPWPSA